MGSVTIHYSWRPHSAADAGEEGVIREDGQPGWRRVPPHARFLGWGRGGGQERFDEPLEGFQV